jgi:flavin-dependent dehydrogenase
MTKVGTYDVAIAGGGLAGLTMSVHLARMGYKVILFEKEKYPFHRVCGEYISLESAAYLKLTGIDIFQLGLPIINKLIVTAPDGTSLQHELPLGGFGISRFTLDHMLAGIAKEAGVELMENDKVTEMEYIDGHFQITARSGNYQATVAVGSFGKRSNLDVKWERGFTKTKPSKLNNYIGVKYHIRTDHPKDTIVLHNFLDGYCGMSAVEEERSCLCYLTTAKNLERSGNSIVQMEKQILSMNPHLAKIFAEAVFINRDPVTISQVSFDKKNCIEHHVLLTGDAAGMITPLCGNGMSMAMHAGKIAVGLIDEFLQGRISRDKLENDYSAAWDREFASRLKTGRFIQGMFGKPVATNMFIRTMKPFPAAVRMLIKQTHGNSF